MLRDKAQAAEGLCVWNGVQRGACLRVAYDVRCRERGALADRERFGVQHEVFVDVTFVVSQQVVDEIVLVIGAASIREVGEVDAHEFTDAESVVERKNLADFLEAGLQRGLAVCVPRDVVHVGGQVSELAGVVVSALEEAGIGDALLVAELEECLTQALVPVAAAITLAGDGLVALIQDVVSVGRPRGAFQRHDVLNDLLVGHEECSTHVAGAAGPLVLYGGGLE